MNTERIKTRVLHFLEQLDFTKEFIKEVSGSYFSYEQFFGQSLAYADYLQEKVAHKTVVAVMDNGLPLASLYFSMMFLHQNLVVIDPQKGATEIAGILEEIPEKLLVTEVAFQEKLEQVQEKNSDTSGLIFLPCDLEIPVQKEGLKTQVLSYMRSCDFEKEYLRTFTSGTSGKPKGVKNSLFNLFAAAIALGEQVEMGRYNTLGHCMPMTYMGGILNTLFMPFIFGQGIVLLPRFDVKLAISFWKYMDKEEIDAIWLAPTMLDTILQLDRGTLGESYCEKKKPLFLIGFSNLTPQLREKWESRYGVALLLSYGLTETLFVSTEIPNIPVKQTVGVLLEGVAWQEVDGEFLISVPWMFLGYSNVDTAGAFQEGYYKTGDIVEIRDGFVKITGRTKDLIIRGGMNVSPIMIENVVNTHPAVKECSVAGTTDMNREEQVICAYVLEEQSTTTDLQTQVQEMIFTALGKNYRVDGFLELDSLPRNTNGKIDKSKLLELLKG